MVRRAASCLTALKATERTLPVSPCLDQRRNEQLALSRIDVCLDPLPHGDGVSTWEALYLSVRIVTQLGQGTTARMAGAILSATGLADWIAKDDQGLS
jgi:predicted O-linked N-acetylglucosamine transferase (SPINDLY family)